MLYKFEKVVDGIAKYIDSEIYSGMYDLQEVMARIVIGRLIENEDAVKKSLINNGVIRTFGFVDSEGMVDIDTLRTDIKKEIERKGKLTISIPMFGKLTFVPEDVDVIYRYITEGGGY